MCCELRSLVRDQYITEIDGCESSRIDTEAISLPGMDCISPTGHQQQKLLELDRTSNLQNVPVHLQTNVGLPYLSSLLGSGECHATMVWLLHEAK